MNDISEAPRAFEVPTPKFQVGQTVYEAIVEHDNIDECPDCGNSREWSVTTGSGLTFKIPCPRCKHRSDNGVLWDAKQFTAKARPFVIGKIEITYGEEGAKVEYGESGKKYGQTTREAAFYATVEEALAAAREKEAKLFAEYVQRNEDQRIKHEICRRPIAEAIVPVLQAELDKAKERYDGAVEAIKEAVERSYKFKASEEEVKEVARSILEQIGEETPDEWEYS